VKLLRSPAMKEKGSGRCATSLSLSKKEEGRVSPSMMDFDGKVEATLFTCDGEKQQCSRPTATPAMRLGWGASGS
jgi:hypothetical protein